MQSYVRVQYMKTCWIHKTPTHYPLIYNWLSWLWRALRAVTALWNFTTLQIAWAAHNSHMNTFGLSMHLMPNVSARRSRWGGRDKGDKGRKDVCLRLCLIISVVTLKMHKCCLNAIQEMQRAKIEMYSALQQQQQQQLQALSQSKWAGTHFVYCMCLALR